MEEMSLSRAYAIYNKNDDIRLKSSSGGIFYLLAKEVLSSGGVVFGAKFNSSWEVEHGYTEQMDGIAAFMCSKYVQSDMGNNYQVVQRFLDEKRVVLFSGTPCQVYGLKSFLGKAYDNLLTIDFICHGVPSRMVWRKYIGELRENKEIVAISFRDKTEGWSKYSVKIEFSDATSYRKVFYEDLYMKGFLQDLYLRPSCYECKFRGIHRESDITLADFWGVERVMPDFYDARGTGTALVHSEIGCDYLQRIEENVLMVEIDTDTIQETNPSVNKSAVPNDKRELFYKSLSNHNSVMKSIHLCTKTKLHIKVIKLIKRLVMKMLKGNRG